MPRRTTPALVAVALTAALAAAGPVQAGDPLPDIPVDPGGPIPSLPTDALVPAFEGTSAPRRPMPHPPVPQHPFLSPNGTSSMHNDAYSTDAYDVSGPLGRDLRPEPAHRHLRRNLLLPRRPGPGLRHDHHQRDLEGATDAGRRPRKSPLLAPRPTPR